MYGWLYKDSQNKQQGPFSTDEMAIWYQMGYFNDDLEVKRVCEKEYSKLSTRKEITEKKPTPPQQLITDSNKPDTYVDYKSITTEYDNNDNDLTQKAYFNVRTGKFENVTGKSHWEKYNIPSNHEDRLINHYFDLEAYQEYMRSKSQNEGSKKRKVTRKQIEYFKKRKVERKLKKILQS